MANFLLSLFGIIFQIVLWGGVIGMGVGYVTMAMGIGEAWGIPIGILAAVTGLGMLIFVFFGIWYNQKIQHGFTLFVGSLLGLVGGTFLVMMLASLFHLPGY